MDTDLYYLSKSITQYNSWKMRRLKAPSLKATDFQLVDDIVDKVVKKHLGSGYSIDGQYFFAVDPITGYTKRTTLTPEECYKPTDDIKTLAKYYKAPIIFGSAGEIGDTSIFKKLWRGIGVAKDNYAPKEVFWESKGWYIKPLSESLKEQAANFININNKNKQVMNKPELTEGQRRVRVDFNPASIKRVHDFKTIMASAIDAIEKVEDEVRRAPEKIGKNKGDFYRETATAKTDLQKASMMGVAALTHSITFEYLESERSNNE